MVLEILNLLFCGSGLLPATLNLNAKAVYVREKYPKSNSQFFKY
ncbi:hypothetical protein [Campylobacter concisus]|nr:hypothetical protein [Campylobacter concisus]